MSLIQLFSELPAQMSLVLFHNVLKNISENALLGPQEQRVDFFHME